MPGKALNVGKDLSLVVGMNTRGPKAIRERLLERSAKIRAEAKKSALEKAAAEEAKRAARAARRKFEKEQWPKYGARKKKWKNPRRVDARMLALEMVASTGSKNRRAYLDRVLGPELEKEIIKDGKKVKKLEPGLLRRIFKDHRTTRDVILPKEFEYVPLGMALRRAFASINLPDKKKRIQVAEILERMHSDGKIDFEGETSVDFSKDNVKKIGKVLKLRGNEFIENFKKCLMEETGWVREYLHLKGQRTVRHEWHWTHEFDDRG